IPAANPRRRAGRRGARGGLQLHDSEERAGDRRCPDAARARAAGRAGQARRRPGGGAQTAHAEDRGDALMQIRVVGRGRMGGNMVHRILRDSDEHEVIAYDPGAEAMKAAVEVGAGASEGLEDLVSKLDKPRAVWLMLPAGEITQQSVDKLCELLDEG